MDIERARAYLLSLPLVVETQQWGDNLVFWTGDKTLGGKMFCVLSLDGVSLTGSGQTVASYPVGAERFQEVLERDGLRAAPYFARIFWVAAERWEAWRNSEWEDEFRAAHEMTLAKLPPKAKRALGLLPEKQAKSVGTKKPNPLTVNNVNG